MRGVLHSFLALVFCLSAAAVDPIPRDVAKSAFEHAAQILQTYPPDKYFIVGFGPSAGPIASAMRVLVGNPALLENYLMEAPVTDYRSLDANQRNTALTRLLPTQTDLQGREVVFVRVLLGGMTMERIAQDVRRLRNSEGEFGRQNQKIHGYLMGQQESLFSNILSDDAFRAHFGGELNYQPDDVLPSYIIDSHGNHSNKFSSFNPITAEQLLDTPAKMLWQANPSVKATDEEMAKHVPIPPPLSQPKLNKIKAALAAASGRHYGMARRSYLSQFADGRNCRFPALAQ